MTRAVLITAITTGVFCAGFALLVNAVTEMLSFWQIAAAGAVSGFLGSLFANLVWRRK